MISRLEHIGIAHQNIEEGLRLYALLFGLSPYKSETVEREGVSTHFIAVGNTKIEALESLAPTSAIAKFIERKGQGIHHLAFETPDIYHAHQHCLANGFQPLNEPQVGADGKEVFFLHPKQTQGILIEFCQQVRPVADKPVVWSFGIAPDSLKEVAFICPSTVMEVSEKVEHLAFFGEAVQAFQSFKLPQTVEKFILENPPFVPLPAHPKALVLVHTTHPQAQDWLNFAQKSTHSVVIQPPEMDWSAEQFNGFLSKNVT